MGQIGDYFFLISISKMFSSSIFEKWKIAKDFEKKTTQLLHLNEVLNQERSENDWMPKLFVVKRTMRFSLSFFHFASDTCNHI